jgi:hypothetical protein
VQRDDTEQPLHRAGHGVEALDTAQRDRGLLGADDAGLEVHALLVDAVAGAAPA